MNSSNYLGSTPPECAFKLNNKYVLDLSTGNTIPEQTSDTFIALTQGTYRVSTDFGNITALHLTPGVYIEVAFETKEKTYSLESEDVTVKALKETWQTKKAGYEASPATATKAEVDSAYAAYIKTLEEALEEAFSEEGNYAL
jgi:hypothetical protein